MWHLFERSQESSDCCNINAKTQTVFPFFRKADGEATVTLFTAPVFKDDKLLEPIFVSHHEVIVTALAGWDSLRIGN